MYIHNVSIIPCDIPEPCWAAARSAHGSYASATFQNGARLKSEGMRGVFAYILLKLPRIPSTSIRRPYDVHALFPNEWKYHQRVTMTLYMFNSLR